MADATLNPGACAGPFSLNQANERLGRLYGRAQVPLRRVLEAGGGSACHFRLPEEARLIALDIDRGQLVRNAASDARVLGDLHTLPLGEGSIDMTVCFNVIEHLEDPERVVRLLARALKPGGLMVLGCPLRESLKGLVTRATPLAWRRAYYRFVVGKRDPGGDGHYDVFPTYFRPVVSQRALLGLLGELGLEVEYLRSYDGAAEYQVTRGSWSRRAFAVPYYAVASAGAFVTRGRWNAAESDLLLIARKCIVEGVIQHLHPQLARIAERFCCPTCRAPVPMEGAQLRCNVCQVAYPLRDGVPFLLNPGSQKARDQELSSGTGTRMVEEYEAGGFYGPSTRSMFERLRPPGLLYHGDPNLAMPRTIALYEHQGPETLVLNVGGGPRRYRPSEITVNLDVFPNVDVVADAHRLPFMDDTFDSILSIAVLEHVHDPETVVSEMVRTLKPGGLLYAEVPFVFFFHGYPNDFRRYTREGMRRLFSSLSDLEVGPVSGPVSAVLQSTNILLQMFLPKRAPTLRKLFNGAFRTTTFGFKYLDIALMRREEAHLLAAGFYVLGRKAPEQSEATQ